MNALILFDNIQCRKFSCDVTPSELVSKYESFAQLTPNIPLIGQVAFVQNQLTTLSTNIKVLLANTEEHHFSTAGIQPVRVGSAPRDHIFVKDTGATFAIYHGFLDVLDSCGVYLNGSKIGTGKYNLSLGDSIWAGTTNIIVNEGYISCLGTEYISRLNLSTLYNDDRVFTSIIILDF